GTASMKLKVDRAEDFLFISEIAEFLDFQSKGIGRKIIHLCANINFSDDFSPRKMHLRVLRTGQQLPI
ncbi:MAG: hypothetical protein ABIP02_00810, partial [Arenimonas sp.]